MKKCANCGKPVPSKNPRALYCSNKCKLQAHRRKKEKESEKQPKSETVSDTVTETVKPSKDSELVRFLRSELQAWQDQCKALTDALNREQHLHAGTLAELKQTRLELQSAKDVQAKNDTVSTVSKDLKRLRDKLYRLRQKLKNKELTDVKRLQIETEIQAILTAREKLKD